MCTDLSNLVQERIAEEFSDKELEALTEGLKRVFEILEEVPSLEKLAEEHAEHAAE
jgi:hypothetical protein